MSGYQHIQKYKGSLYGNPTYSGIEYDYEVPDNVVVSSPGGVSGIHHHYTKGIYSDASSNQDIHAGNPLADGYPYGEYGGMYQVGQSATRYMGDFMEPADLNADNNYTGGQTEIKREAFSKTDDVELIVPGKPIAETPGSTPIDQVSKNGKDPMSLLEIIKIISVFTVGYIAINFFVKGGETFISERLYKGKTISWKQYLVLGALFSIALLFMALLFGIPLVVLEKI